MKRLLVSLVAVFLLVSCTQNDAESIKGSTMSQYGTTTVGDAFTASFDEPKWTAFKGTNGERVVEFTGKISQQLHDKWLNEFVPEFIPLFASDPTIKALTIQAFTNKIKENPELGNPADKWQEEAAAKGLGEIEASIYVTTKLVDYLPMWTVGAPVTVQWQITPDGKSFKIAYWESEAWKNLAGGKLGSHDILKFIF